MQASAARCPTQDQVQSAMQAVCRGGMPSQNEIAAACKAVEPVRRGTPPTSQKQKKKKRRSRWNGVAKSARVRAEAVEAALARAILLYDRKEDRSEIRSSSETEVSISLETPLGGVINASDASLAKVYPGGQLHKLKVKAGIRFVGVRRNSNDNMTRIKNLKELKTALAFASADSASDTHKTCSLVFVDFNPEELISKLQRRAEVARRLCDEQEQKAATILQSIFRRSKKRTVGKMLSNAIEGGQREESPQGSEQSQGHKGNCQDNSSNNSDKEEDSNANGDLGHGSSGSGSGAGYGGGDGGGNGDNDNNNDDRSCEKDASKSRMDTSDEKNNPGLVKLQAIQRGKRVRAKISSIKDKQHKRKAAAHNAKDVEDLAASDRKIVEDLLRRLELLDERKGTSSEKRQEAAENEAQARKLLMFASEQLKRAAAESSVQGRGVLVKAGKELLEEAGRKDGLAARLLTEAEDFDNSFNLDVITLRSDCIRYHDSIERLALSSKLP